MDTIIKSEKIQGVKIDVENFDFFELKGDEEILKRDHPIVYAELWDNQYRINCFELLSSLSYKIFIVKENELVSYDNKKHISQNFIFIAN